MKLVCVQVLKENAHTQEWIKSWKKPVIKHGEMTKKGYMVEYPESFSLGSYFDISFFTYINAHYGVEIQDFVQIGPHSSILSHSTIDNKKGSIILKTNCKIGANSTIMPNVTIGENSVVAAHSFVNKNIPKNELWAGVPAKFKAQIPSL